MSITLGVYDLFAYMVPGIFYLYIANEFLNLFGLKHFEFRDFDNIAVAILALIVSYILGQTFDIVANRWRRWRQKGETSKNSIEKLKKDHPNREIKFLPQDWPFLLSLIRRDHPEVATSTDRSKAISIMFQNLSLGLLLYAVFQITSFFVNGFSIGYLAILIIAFVGALLSKHRSQLYNRWFYDHIYETALTYDNETDKIIQKLHGRELVKDD